MKIATILILLFICISTASGQGNTPKTVGVIYELSDCIYHYLAESSMSDNYEKSYPQHDSINEIIEGLLDKEIKKIIGMEVHKLPFSLIEISDMIRKDSLGPVSSFDMIMVITEEGITKEIGIIAPNVYVSTEITYKGRGIITGFGRRAQIYANLGVELINISNNKRMIYDLKEHILSTEGQYIAINRTMSKFFSPGENKKEFSQERIIEIERILLEMYRIQVKRIFDPYVLNQTVTQLFK